MVSRRRNCYLGNLSILILSLMQVYQKCRFRRFYWLLYLILWRNILEPIRWNNFKWLYLVIVHFPLPIIRDYYFFSVTNLIYFSILSLKNNSVWMNNTLFYKWMKNIQLFLFVQNFCYSKATNFIYFISIIIINF